MEGASNPFKGLAPFDPGDTLFGRDADLTVMKDRIFRAKTTLLFAGSGVGKTSFFRAKFIPELERRYPQQLAVRYHNQWSGRDPLEALKASLAADARASLLEHFRSISTPSGAWVLVLDQFEELFQYHTYWPHFARFRDEVSEVVNSPDALVRLVFAMREEFLGQLSAFDNRIPDLFSNYYRLKNPDKSQAAEIIRSTSETAGVEIDEAGLQALIDDLSKFEPPGSRAGKTPPVMRDYVVPPHLQLVCRGLWEEEARAATDGPTGRFLEGYAQPARRGRRNRARRILEEFCVSRMKALTPEEQAIAARSFDYLVTSQGAKMAYELKSLARHMGADETLVARTLGKLSADARILRESRWGQDERWFELYHDMYAPIMYEWKERFERQQRKERQLEDHAIICDRRALHAEARENRDEALMFWLKAIETRDTEKRRRQAGRLAATAAGLERTFRHDGPVIAAAFGAAGRRVVVASSAPLQAAAAEPEEAERSKGRSILQVWDVETAAPVGQPVYLEAALVALALSPDGEAVAACDRERLYVIEATKARVRTSWPTPAGPWPRPAVRFSRDGKKVLVLFSGPRATWFAVSRRGAGKEVKPNRFWERLVVAEDGRHIAAARGRMIEVFEPATATAVGSPMQLEDRPGAIAFHPDGRKLLIGMRNGIAEVRDMFTGARLGLPLRHHGAIARVAFTASGPVSTLSLAERRSGPAVLTRWDSETAEATELLRIPYRGPAFPQFSRTGRFLHFEPSRGAQIWNVETGVPLAPMWERQPRRRTQWSEDDGLVLTSGRGAARLWSTASAPAPRYTIENAAGMASRLLTMDGNHVLILNSDGVACLWTIDGALLREIPHTTPVQSVAVGPAGRVATLGGGTLRVWTSRGDEMAKIRARVDGDVHFDPTGATIFLQSARGPLRAWRYATGDRRTWALTTGALVPRRKGRHFATHETFAEELIIWDAITRRKVATCRHEGGAVVVVMSPDSRMLLSGGQDGRAVVWKASDGARLHELPHHGPIVAAAISETGHHAATLSADQFLRLWELGTGGEVARFRYEGGGRTLDFSPDGSTLILASKWWIHSFDVRGGLAPRASRGLEGAWTGQYRFLTPSGGRIRVLVEPGPAGFRVDEVDFDAVDSVPLEGSADALQKEWSGRTGLTYEGEEVAPAAIVKGWRPAAARRRSTVRRTVARIAEVSEPL